MDEFPVLFVGFKSAPVSGIDKILTYPTPPANYTKQETIDAWYQDKYPDLVSNMQEEAAYCGLTGRIDDIYAVDPTGMRASPRASDIRNPSAAFLNWAAFGGNGPVPNLNAAESIRLIGFDVADFSRVCGLEAQLAGLNVPASFWSAPGYSFDNMRSLRIDPYKVLVPSDQRSLVSIQGLLTIAGIPYPQDWTPHVDPYVDCELAIRLAIKFNLTDHLRPSASSFRCNSQIGVTVSEAECCGGTCTRPEMATA